MAKRPDTKQGARAAKAAAPLLLAGPPPFPHRCLPHLRQACVRCFIPTGDAAFDIEPFV